MRIYPEKYNLSKYNLTKAEVCFPNYVKVENGREYLLFLTGDLGKLQSICDKWFNIPSNGYLKVKPISNKIIVKVLDCNCAAGPNCMYDESEITSCNHEECRTATFLNEYDDPLAHIMFNALDFSFFVKDTHGTEFLFAPYRFTDNGILMVNERELLGFPTSYAQFGYFSEDKRQNIIYNKTTPIDFFNKSDLESFQCLSKMNFKFPDGNMVTNEYAEGGLATKPEVLIELKRNHLEQNNTNKNIEEFEFKKYLESLLDDRTLDKVGQVHLPQMVNLLLKRRKYLSMIQFREISDGNKAMVQTIFEVHGENVKILRLGYLNHSYNINFQNWETDSINTYMKMKEKDDNEEFSAKTATIEVVKNNVNIVNTLGIETFTNIKGCYVDVNYGLNVQKVIFK